MSSVAIASNDHQDLDDIRGWKDLVRMETCLDAALDLIPGDARKLEMKLEGDDPVYEFQVHGDDDTMYNIECNAEEGVITEVERSVAKEHPVFQKLAKVSEADAREFALMIHPGTVVETEYEIGFDGTVTYEFDIVTELGYEMKVDVNAVTGEIEEANIELYEIGSEKELD
jgi:uncharacterized membrane protein YkoI